MKNKENLLSRHTHCCWSTVHRWHSWFCAQLAKGGAKEADGGGITNWSGLTLNQNLSPSEIPPSHAIPWIRPLPVYSVSLRHLPMGKEGAGPSVKQREGPSAGLCFRHCTILTPALEAWKMQLASIPCLVQCHHHLLSYPLQCGNSWSPFQLSSIPPFTPINYRNEDVYPSFAFLSLVVGIVLCSNSATFKF